MINMNEDLAILQKQVLRKKQLEAMLAELYKQKSKLEKRKDALHSQMLSEQADVDRLEGRSLAAFFYSIVGKMDERLDAERREAYEARVKYDAAAASFNSVVEDIQRCEAEKKELTGCELRYEQLLQQKASSLKALGGSVGEEILELESRLGVLENQRREIFEAISAGQAALETAESVRYSLGKAENWSTWDMLGGDGLTDMIKHGHMNEAQYKIEQLQVLLRRFKTELIDVSIDADMDVSMDNFMRFADYFFDGLFVDWAVRDKIHRAQDRMDMTVGQIRSTLDRLSAMAQDVHRRANEAKAQLDDLIVKS